MIRLYGKSLVAIFLHFTMSQDSLTLLLDRFQDPLIVQESVTSEIRFSIFGADDVTNYSLALAHVTKPSSSSYYGSCALHVTNRQCWGLTPEECACQSQCVCQIQCQCQGPGEGGRHFTVSKTFQAGDAGTWMLALWSHDVKPVVFNVTVLGATGGEVNMPNNTMRTAEITAHGTSSNKSTARTTRGLLRTDGNHPSSVVRDVPFHRRKLRPVAASV